MKLRFGCVLLATMLARAPESLAQPTAPAPPQPTPNPTAPTPTPAPAPSPSPSPAPPAPEGGIEVPQPNPSAPPPGTQPAPAPASTATTATTGTATNGAVDKKTATERRLAAQAACNAREPSCNWIMTFSSLEKLSIRRSLAALGLEVEPAPWDKVIGTIRIYNEDVFAEKNWLRFFNIFHVTTRDSAIRGELTVNEGEVWNDELIAESARRLKDPLYTGVVALLPVKSAEPGKVDLLVVTRDIWSLRLNTRYGIQQNTLTDLSISLSENNFLGRRKTVAVGFLVDQGSIAIGPLFIDKNFLGQHLDFRVRIDRIFTRRSLDVIATDPTNPMATLTMPSGDPGGLQDESTFRTEGHQATVALTKTLWSLASKWGGGGSFTYRNAINRTYRGTGLRAVDNLETPEVEFLGREYRMKSWTVRGSATRQWGGEYKHAVEVGYSVSSARPSLLPNFPDDPALQQFFRDEVFPRSEVVSSPFIEYGVFRAKYKTVRNIDSFDLAEDLRLGPNASIGIQQSVELLGSDANFTRPSVTVGWTFPWSDDGFVRLSAGGQLRIQTKASSGASTPTIDNSATGQIRAATPTLGYFRLVGQAHFETRWNETNNGFYTLGSDSGLRAYDIAQFIGDRRVVGQIEARSVPYPFWVLRLGAVAFYEVGGAAASFDTMQLHHDVGVGFRMLIPQTARDLFRFDFAKPLDGQHGCPIPGNICFIAGFDSYF